MIDRAYLNKTLDIFIAAIENLEIGCGKGKAPSIIIQIHDDQDKDLEFHNYQNKGREFFEVKLEDLRTMKTLLNNQQKMGRYAVGPGFEHIAVALSNKNIVKKTAEKFDRDAFNAAEEARKDILLIIGTYTALAIANVSATPINISGTLFNDHNHAKEDMSKAFQKFEALRDNFELEYNKKPSDLAALSSIKAYLQSAAEKILEYPLPWLRENNPKDFDRLVGFIHNKKLDPTDTSYIDMKGSNDKYGLILLRGKVALPAAPPSKNYKHSAG